MTDSKSDVALECVPDIKVEPEPAGEDIVPTVKVELEDPKDRKVAVDDVAKCVIKTENGCESLIADTKCKVEKKESTEDSSFKTAEDEKDPDLEAKIVRQVEYYFGDVNLPRDKFLQEQIKLDDGWVPLDVMLRFKRLKSLSSNPETVASCLLSSSTLMEVSEERTRIRRLPSKPLPDFNPEYVKELLERTVYCKGFPQTLNDIDVLLKYFGQFGPVDNVNMRKYNDAKNQKKHVFKGSVYVLFKTKELAEKFLALESVTYEGKELIRMTRAAHMEEQKRERDERWGKKVKPKKSDDVSNSSSKELPKGCILKLSPISNEGTSRDAIKEALVSLGAGVAFIQYNKGDTEAFVRLQSTEDGAALKFIKSLEDAGKKLIIDNEVEVTSVDGEEEEAFLERTRLAFGKCSQKGHAKRGGRNWGGRNNFDRYRGRKRAGSPISDNATPAKQSTTSD